MIKQPKRERIRADQLKIDEHIQRDLDPNRADRMSKKFNRAALGTLTVSRRGPGQVFILDGQTRWTANRLAGHEEAFLNCDVFEGLTLAEEAEIYEQLNDTKRLAPLDLHKARRVRQDPVALGMDALAEKHGLQISRTSANALMAVRSFEKLFTASEATADRTLAVLTGAWHARREAVSAKILEGVGALLMRYHDQVDDKTLVAQLQAEFGGPLDLYGRSKTFGATMGSDHRDAVATLVVLAYNRHKRRTVSKLPTWEV